MKNNIINDFWNRPFDYFLCVDDYTLGESFTDYMKFKFKKEFNNYINEGVRKYEENRMWMFWDNLLCANFKEWFDV